MTVERFDGDICMSTDSKVLANSVMGGNPITYQKKPTEKKHIKTEDLYKADLLAFDGQIGFLTNMSTTLYAMLPLYEEGTREYEEIIHRLKECRIAQGNEID